MIGWLIVACEIGFWIFVIVGLFFRYILRLKKLGGFILLSTPIIDLILVAVTIYDLKNGTIAGYFHGLSAVYVGITVGFGHGMIQWADDYFSFLFANGPEPTKSPKSGKEHARAERTSWMKHLLSWAIGCVILGFMIILVGDSSRTEKLFSIIYWWSIVLSIDFLWSFSYTIWPKKAKKKNSTNVS